MRFMKKGKEVEKNQDEGTYYFWFAWKISWSIITISVSDVCDLENESEVKQTVRVPHSRVDLLSKFESLKVAQDDDGEEDNESGSDFEDEDDSFDDDS